VGGVHPDRRLAVRCTKQRGWAACAAALAVAFGGAANAGVATSIHSDGSLGTKVTASGSTVTIDGGALAGSNLFESFADFSLATGATAMWTWSGGNASTISNVVNRVTGGAVSEIDGTLDSTRLPHASFWFINRAGIVFGAGASVNVPAAAYFSTAQLLRFADGKILSSATPTGSTLSMAAPSDFGFLGPRSDLLIDGAGAGFHQGAGKLSLSAANIAISNTASPIVVASLDLFAVGGLNLYLPITGGPTGALAAAGSVRLVNTGISSNTASAARGGDITISAGSIDLQNSQLTSAASGTGAGGDIFLNAGNLILEEASQVGATTSDANRDGGDGGDITLAAGALTIASGASVTTDTSGSGRGGDISVHAQTLTIQGQYPAASNLTASVSGSGDGGGITLDVTGSFTLDGGDISTINSLANLDGGRVGNITVNAATFTSQNFGEITSYTFDERRGGDISINTDVMNGTSGGILTDSVSSGAGGDIVINARTMTFGDSGFQDAYTVEANAGSSGNGGNIVLAGLAGQSANIAVQKGQIGTYSFGHFGGPDIPAETTGSVTVDAGPGGTLIVSPTSVIQSLHTGFGHLDGGSGGDITLEAGAIEIHGSVSTNTDGGGDGGSIRVDAGTLTVANGAFSSDTGSPGRGGDIVVHAQTIDILNSSISSSTFTGAGRAGDITLQAADIDIDGSSVTTSSLGPGNAGTIIIEGGDLEVTGGSSIESATYNLGNAGGVALSLTGEILVDASSISVDAVAGSTGAAGNLTVKAATLRILDGGSVSSNSANANIAGDIAIDAPDILIDGPGSRISSANSGVSGGAAGAIRIVSDPITLSDGGAITTNSATGAAGDISLTFDHGGLLTLEGAQAAGAITTSSGTNSGGRITIAGPSAIILNGGEIQALGPSNLASATIQAGVVIESSDRPNSVAVAGTLVLDSKVVDVSQAVTVGGVAFEDASKVLRGQCPALRARGETSQLGMSLHGPYGPTSALARAPSPSPQQIASGCGAASGSP
jgi:filamentous hemagglutinin family protein